MTGGQTPCHKNQGAAPCQISASTSAIVGIEGAAPTRVTAIEEAFAAVRSAVCISAPSVSFLMKKPVNVSPAAVVSTALTGKMSWNTFSVPS